MQHAHTDSDIQRHRPLHMHSCAAQLRPTLLCLALTAGAFTLPLVLLCHWVFSLLLSSQWDQTHILHSGIKPIFSVDLCLVSWPTLRMPESNSSGAQGGVLLGDQVALIHLRNITAATLHALKSTTCIAAQQCVHLVPVPVLNSARLLMIGCHGLRSCGRDGSCDGPRPLGPSPTVIPLSTPAPKPHPAPQPPSPPPG